jgi:hypothetical protein
MAERKVVPFDEFYYRLKLMNVFQKHLYIFTKYKITHYQYPILHNPKNYLKFTRATLQGNDVRVYISLFTLYYYFCNN